MYLNATDTIQIPKDESARKFKKMDDIKVIRANN